ncbi:unnamed protein product, partial [Didymodactylos carnosus]
MTGTPPPPHHQILAGTSGPPHYQTFAAATGPPHHQTFAGISYQTLAGEPQNAPAPPLPHFVPEQQQPVRPANDGPQPASSSVRFIERLAP